MSDSDDDLLQNNHFTFYNENTTISARGPNVNNINITGLSIHNNVLTSTERYTRSNVDQRSMRYNIPSNFNCSTIRRGTHFQKSLYSARSGSPATVHSIDSVRATDIVFALKNERFNKHELKAIKEAFNMLMKTSHRKRVEKRRNHRLLMKRNHQHSGDDSGEQGSDSSISSDDCRSIKTTTHSENIQRVSHMRNLAHFSKNIRENQMFRDCSESIKQSRTRNLCSISSTASNYGTREKFQHSTAIDQSQSSMKVQNTSIMTQKERFKKGFLLPSQRFNKKNGLTQVIDKDKIITAGNTNEVGEAMGMVGLHSDSDSEEVFRGFSKNRKKELGIQTKRALENDGVHYSDNKRTKLNSSRGLQNTECVDLTLETGTNSTMDDFIFAKPQMPTKKARTKIDLGPANLLARSKVPVITEENDLDIMQDNIIKSNKEANNEVTVNAKQPDTAQSTNDVSMRPSFIKRKLYTQKLDVAENKNLSCDMTPANSPQNVYSASMREKNKARKLVASQSCLSREVLSEDKNILDLIHKIVPANQINVANAANKTDLCSKSNNVDNSEKWDVTTAILNCKNQDTSDTYTDEEIFNVTYNKNLTNATAVSGKSTKNAKEYAQCKVFVEKLNCKDVQGGLKENNNYELPQLKSTCKEINKKSVTDCVKSFWDTEFESDMELDNVTQSWRKNSQRYQECVHKEKTISEDKPKDSNKVALIPKGTILTVRNCHREPKLNISVKSRKNHVANDKNITENIDSNLLVQDKDIRQVGTTANKLSDKKLYTEKTNNNEKENVALNKQQGSGRKSKAKRGANGLVENKNTGTSQRSNSNAKLRDKDSKETIKTLNNNKKISVIETSKQTEKNTSNKTAKSSKNTDVNIKKQITNVKIQPKRKSKENTSYILYLQPSARSNNTKTPNTRTKTSKQLRSKNTSLNSINTRSTNSSRDKLQFNCSACDGYSGNISNISNRSLRLRQRKINELYKSRL